MEVKGPEASSHSLAIPSTRKRFRPWGNVGASHRSPSTSNLTCFLVSQLVWGHHVTAPYPWISMGFVCKLRFFIEQLSCSLAGWDLGGLGKGD